MDFSEIDRLNDRLDKIEDNTLDIIERSLNKDFRNLEKIIDKNYLRFKDNLELLPDEKANSLFGKLNTNINGRDRSKTLNSLYQKVSSASSQFNQKNIDKAIIPANLNDPIDFWTIDGNNRINDWTDKFVRDIQATIQFAYSQKWSKKTLIAAIRSRYGTLKSEVFRVVSTGVTGVTAANSERFALFNNRDFVILKTTEDDRVCPFCAAREGNIYRIGQISLPLHPSCRCVLIPLTRAQTRDKSLLQQLNQFKETAKDELKAAGGKPNYGPAPFEKKNGAIEAPRPINS